MNIKKTFKITDIWGNIQKGKTVMVYPSGTIANGTEATDNNDGTYTVEFNPFTNPDVMNETYDIWWDDSKQRSDVSFGEWLWRFKINMTSTIETIVYANLKDSEGEPIIPSKMPKAECVGLVSKKDFPVSCIDIDDLSITLQRGSFGSGIFPIPIIVSILAGSDIKEAV